MDDLKQALRPGDVLLYTSSGLIGRIIRRKTTADDLWGGFGGPSHVEIYLGLGESFASRDWIGTDIYPLRERGLIGYLTPQFDVNVERLRTCAREQSGKPYDFGAIWSFFTLGRNGANSNGKDICSEAVVNVLRCSGHEPFRADVPAAAISPASFLLSPKFVLFRRSYP